MRKNQIIWFISALLQSSIFLSAYWCTSNDINSEKRKPLRQTCLYLSEFYVGWIPPSFTEPACIFVSFPSPRLPPSLRLSASFPSFFFFHCEQLYCSILKVPACVLSCPLLPSMHRSDLELCRLRMGAHFWCRERRGGTGRRYDAALYTPFNGFPQHPLLSSIWKGLFFCPLRFARFFFILALKYCPWGWKKGEKTRHCCKQSVSRRIVLMWPTLASTGESNSNCQAEREGGGVCVCVCIV